MILAIKAATCLILCATQSTPGDNGRSDAPWGDDVILTAMADELDRSMSDLQLQGLGKPYHLRIAVEESDSAVMSATYGALLTSERRRSRFATSRVRVGSYELDNTGVGFGGRTALPLDDDYLALRHSLWLMIDGDYKLAVEMLTRKQAFLRQKSVADRPDDFTEGEGATQFDPPPSMPFDRDAWERRIRKLSARFELFPRIQDASVSLAAALGSRRFVDSDGTRLRIADTGFLLTIRAQIQADDGMELDDALVYVGEQMDEAPRDEQILADIDKMCERLVALADAPVLEDYFGPVLFSAKASGRVFASMLARGLCARPIPLGRGGGGDQSLARKIGRRILPKTFEAWDDPTSNRFNGTLLVGAYRFDDEGTPAMRVELVRKGILQTLLAGRAPTKKIKETNGHARSSRFGDPEAEIGCLYLRDNKGLSPDEMREALLQAARDEGLDHGLRVESLDEGYGGDLGNPRYAYRVHLDGREELVRGLEFRPVESRELKRLLAAGATQEVYNDIGGVSRSVIAPAVLFEELELTRIERELDKLPILKAPGLRAVKDDPNDG